MARAALTGTRIRERRAQLGLKQADLARAVGLSPAYLNLIEHNRRPVNDTRLAEIAQALGCDPQHLAEGAATVLFDQLREAAAARPEIAAETARIEEFAGRYPGWAALLAERQAALAGRDRRIEALTERLAHDPHLAASLHEILSAVTAIRATAAILAETDDIDPTWRQRFHQNLHDDSERLAHGAEALAGYLDTGSDSEATLAAPQEEFDAWLASHSHHLPALESQRPPDAEQLIRSAPELASPAAQDLARRWIKAARALVQTMPLDRFLTVRAQAGGDLGRIAAVFGLSPLAVFRRLAMLPATAPSSPGGGGAGPIPGLVICDGAGAITFHRPVEGFNLPRLGAGCPLWPLYQALSQPNVPIRCVIEMAGRMPRRFLAHAFCQASWPQGFGGAQVLEAAMLLTPLPAIGGPGDTALREQGGDSAAPERFSDRQPDRLVGPTCRLCPRAQCPARREASILEAEPG